MDGTTSYTTDTRYKSCFMGHSLRFEQPSTKCGTSISSIASMKGEEIRSKEKISFSATGGGVIVDEVHGHRFTL